MDNAAILEQIRAARKIEVKVGHITFKGICPTYSKLMRIISNNAQDAPDAVIAAMTINDWEGATLADIIPGGDKDELVSFDKDIFEELVFDRQDWWKPISIAVAESVTIRQTAKEKEIKNSTAGTMAKRSKGSKAPKT